MGPNQGAQASSKLKSKSGQAVLEYILLLFIVVVGVSFVSKTLQTIWERAVLGMGNKLERSLKTGRIPENVWKD